MSPEPAPPEIEFDGRMYDEAGLAAALASAGRGVVPSNNRELFDDPQTWCRLLIGEALHSPLAEGAGRGVTQLLQSEEPEALELAASLQQTHHIGDPAATLDAMERRLSQGDATTLFSLSFALLCMENAVGFQYDPRTRRFASDRDACRALMCLFLRYDRPWLLAHLTEVLPAELGLAAGYIGGAVSGLPAEELEAIRGAFAPLLPGLSAEMADAMRLGLQITNS